MIKWATIRDKTGPFSQMPRGPMSRPVCGLSRDRMRPADTGPGQSASASRVLDGSRFHNFQTDPIDAPRPGRRCLRRTLLRIVSSFGGAGAPRPPSTVCSATASSASVKWANSKHWPTLSQISIDGMTHSRSSNDTVRPCSEGDIYEQKNRRRGHGSGSVPQTRVSGHGIDAQRR